MTDDELISRNLLEANPENKELQDKVAGQLKAHLETNPAIAEELEVLIAKLRVLETKQNALSVQSLILIVADAWVFPYRRTSRMSKRG